MVPGAFNVALDAAAVGLPVYEVMKLNLSRKKKLVVFGVFLIGGLYVMCDPVSLPSSLYLPSFFSTRDFLCLT